MDALLLVIFLLLATGSLALICSRWPRTATVFGAGGAVLGCLVGLAPTLRALLGASPEPLQLPWDATHGVFAVAADPLSAFFLLPVLGLSALAAVYGSHYLLTYRGTKALGPPWFFFNGFVAGMVLVLLARTAILFLLAWEMMSLAAWALVTFEHEKSDARRAGWIYLVATHLGIAFLFLVFVLLGRRAGSLEFTAFSNLPDLGDLGAGWSGLIFVLAVVGFGTKAGFVPFHVWLPEAHPAAPSHVSALMSGVMIKMGLYGLLRTLTFLGPPALWWGPTLAGLGLLTALVGIALATYQRDLKRILAYSSIENIGLIGLTLGVGLWGWASALPVVAVLGFTAAFLHIWNHSLMKGLMFFAAGSVLHGTGTKDIERLGGLLKRMPVTASLLVVGGVALAALPPLNGFVSKWLMYIALLKCGLSTDAGVSLTSLFAVGLLTLVGGLAALTYVRLSGIVALGSPRSTAAAEAHESSTWLLGPMCVLLMLCLAAALMPQALTGWLIGPLSQLLGPGAAPELLAAENSGAPLGVIGAVNMWTLVAVAGGILGFLALTRAATTAAGPTWACGYLAPSPRMQYTGLSFSEMLAEHLLPRSLRPRTRRAQPVSLFPARGDLRAEYPDPLGARVYEPLARRWADRFVQLRILQQGKINVYLVYIALTVVLALAWLSLRTWWGAS